MSDVPDLRMATGLEALSGIKDVVADFARREELLARESAGRRTASARAQRVAAERMEGERAARLEAVEAQHQADEERLRTTYQRRRALIQKASSDGVRSIINRARHAKELGLGQIQMRHLQAERSMPAELKAVDAAGEEAIEKVDESSKRVRSIMAQTRRVFDAYGSLVALLKPGATPEGESVPAVSLEEMHALADRAEEQLAAFRTLGLPRFFHLVPLPALLVLVVVGAGMGIFATGLGSLLLGPIAVAGLVFGIALIVLHRMGLGSARAPAAELAATLRSAREAAAACRSNAEATHQQERDALEKRYALIYSEIDQHWAQAEQIEKSVASRARGKVEKQIVRMQRLNERFLAPRLLRLQEARTMLLHGLELGAQHRRDEMAAAAEVTGSQTAGDDAGKWDALEAEWRAAALPLYNAITGLSSRVAGDFPRWNAESVEAWTPAKHFNPATPVGLLRLNLTVAPKDPRLALPGPPVVEAPLALTFPEQGCLLVETAGAADASVATILNSTVLRLFSSTPPGKLAFTIIDPVGLGQNFAGLMNLGDYEESLINRRIWTQRDQIEERLAELSEHIEKVIQMYLRNEFATITEYNARAGSVAEKYLFLVVSDFPANFTETSAKRLQSIAVSGPRCGVFIILHRDTRATLPDGFVLDELRTRSLVLKQDRTGWTVSAAQRTLGAEVVVPPAPSDEVVAAFTHKVGQSSVDSNRVEVPFLQITVPAEQRWTGDTADELRVAVGRTGATKLQQLAIGKGTRQHALFAGKTGSGKSTLFHVIITNLALTYSPDQVEFWLIDFKKGVEFKCYASKRLPHARVVAIESDREFALNVLQRVDDELKRRGDLFRKLGVQDVAGYKRAGGSEPMPRSLLIIDEFQEFFVEDDQVAQTASLLFDRIVRQGRAFGIHVLLGSQTLGGAYTLARATLGQMVIRVALQCNEADAYLIMDDSNPAPRLLSRPGEGIYNDAAGAVEGNSPFQVVWLPDDERDHWLDEVNALALAHHIAPRAPIVFEGNAPADVRENEPLRLALATPPVAAPVAPRCWLGAPNAIKGPTEAVFQRQSGNHLLVVGQRDESVLTLLGVALLSLAAQYPAGAARFILILPTAPGASEAAFVEQVAAAVPGGLTVSHGGDLPEVINAVAVEMKARADGEGTAATTFLIIHGLQRFKKLRQEEDFSFSMDADAAVNPGAQLADILREGSSLGIHVIAGVDTFNNVNRFLSRKALTEFEMRVLFQMSANDSASLIDSPKASTLGLHRAIFYNEQAGYTETFRPYATPDADWVRGLSPR